MWRNSLTVHAIRSQHTGVVDDAVGNIMKKVGLWNGEPGTKEAAGREHGQRFLLEEHRTAEPTTVITFDGTRMCAIVTSIELLDGGTLRTLTRAVP